MRLMWDFLPVPAAVFAVLAAVVHVYIFVLESVVFRRSGYRVFRLRAADLPVARDWAYNQGFYNLFLAIGALLGVVLSYAEAPGVAGAGVGMMLLATGSMLAAALVLVTDRPSMLRAAAVQGLPPLLALGSWLIWG
jgi:putative membrane protein